MEERNVERELGQVVRVDEGRIQDHLVGAHQAGDPSTNASRRCLALRKLCLDARGSSAPSQRLYPLGTRRYLRKELLTEMENREEHV